jgi:hypothetical protein
MGLFYQWFGQEEGPEHSLGGDEHLEAVRIATTACAPQAAILFDKFHIMRATVTAARSSSSRRQRNRSGCKP